jgi:tetratricopeptide (TPR) repeat protein
LAFDKGQFDFALCDALEKSEKWADLATASKRLLTSKTFDDAGFAHLVKADEELRDWKGMQTSALDRIKSKPKEIAAWRALAMARMRLGDVAGANEALDKLKDAGGESDAKEMRVWNQVLAGKITEETLTSLKTPRESSHAIGKSEQYLAGFAEIKMMKTDQALDSLKAAIGEEEATALDARAWVLYGDICEQYGFQDAAADSWKRARETKNKEMGAKWALATLKQ